MPLSRETTGTLLTLCGVALLSPDALLVRLVAADPMTINFWRGALLVISLTVWLMIDRKPRRLPRVDRWDALFAAMFALSGLAFIGAITLTSVANVMIMASASPLSAAIAGAVILKQPIGGRTWAAIALAAIGVSIVAIGEARLVEVAPSAPHRSMIGVALAFASAAFIGIGVAARGRSRDDDSRPAMILGAALAAVLALPFADPLSLSSTQSMWMGLLGLAVLPCAFALIFLGPRYIPASRVALIALLEVVLAPIWAWIFLDEAPRDLTLMGGAVILIAVLLNITGSATMSEPAKN